MKNICLYIIVVLLGITAAPTATQLFAQCPPVMNIQTLPVQQLSVADVDFEHFQGRNLLFSITIQNGCSTTRTAHFRGSIVAKLADGSFNGQAATFQSLPFTIQPGPAVYTNLDFHKGGIETSFAFDPGAKSSIQDIALSTGQFPAGEYSFSITLDFDADPDTTGGVIFVIDNPSPIELRSPRDNEVTNEFPLFEFFFNGDRGQLTVAEIRENQSREDAINNTPPMFSTEVQGLNALLYSGARPLESGKSYVWQMVGLSRGAGGNDVALKSPIYKFQVASSPELGDVADSTVGMGLSPASSDAILRQLEELFGQQYPQLFQQIREGDFRLTGSFLHNQSSLSRNELLELLNELRAVHDAVELSFE